jgi:acyl-CoA thioester hydrolase
VTARAEPARERFRFLRDVEVRFRDLDLMGHVHHSLPLIYFEEARAAYWREVAGRQDPDDVNYVMAEVTARYHGRIRFPARLTVGVRTVRMGSKSLDMEYGIWTEAGSLVASGTSVQVMYDYAVERSREIPAALRRRIQQFEAAE